MPAGIIEGSLRETEVDVIASAQSIQGFQAIITVLIIPSLSNGVVVYSCTTLTSSLPQTSVASASSGLVSTSFAYPTSKSIPSTTSISPISLPSHTPTTSTASTASSSAKPTQNIITSQISPFLATESGFKSLTIPSTHTAESSSVDVSSYQGVSPMSLVAPTAATLTGISPSFTPNSMAQNKATSLSPSQMAVLGIGISAVLIFTALAIFIFLRRRQSKLKDTQLNSISDTSTVTNRHLSIAPVYDKAVFYPRRDSKLHGESGHSREAMVDSNGVIWPEKVELKGEAKELREWTQTCLKDYQMRLNLRGGGGNSVGDIEAVMGRGGYEERLGVDGHGDGDTGVAKKAAEDIRCSIVGSGEMQREAVWQWDETRRESCTR